jgi:hypothetical protein
MSKKILPLIIFLLAVIVILPASCKKDNSTTSYSSKKSYLTSSPWKSQKMEVKMDGKTSYTDVTSEMEACMFSRLYTYNASGAFNFTAGCTYDENVSGTWVLSNDGTKLTLSISGESMEFSISQLDNSTLVWTGYYSDSKAYIRSTFTH